jgi:hypothetical protein
MDVEKIKKSPKNKLSISINFRGILESEYMLVASSPLELLKEMNMNQQGIKLGVATCIE